MYSSPGTLGDECGHWDNGCTISEEACKIPLNLTGTTRGVVYDTGDL